MSNLTFVDAEVEKLKALFDEKLHHCKAYYFSKLHNALIQKSVLVLRKEW